MNFLNTKFFIGTSGYWYKWNLGKSLFWYIDHGFKTVEINSTFYRFPYAGMVKGWSSAPEGFLFSVKVNRSISHYSKLKNIDLWEKFKKAFGPMDSKIRFWLLQMPPGYIASKFNIQTVRDFISMSKDERLVFEFRDPSWWDVADSIIDAGALFCSVDAPLLPRTIINSSGTVYMRIHGRTEWYSHSYSIKELDDIAKNIIDSGARSAFVYVNNDLDMFKNALYLLNRYGK
jgi:uncharacterized protein YecE (DUF72 family)